MSLKFFIIIGSGPAAYSAAISVNVYRPLILEGEMVGGIGPGGQLTATTKVDDFPGFPTGTQGTELMKMMQKQVKEMGVRIISKSVVEIKRSENQFIVKDNENQYETKSIIVATGASAKRLSVPGTEDHEFWQKGIGACVVMDCFLERKLLQL